MKSEAYKEKVNTGDEMVARITNNATIIMQEDDLRALHVLLPRGLKIALNSKVVLVRTTTS